MWRTNIQILRGDRCECGELRDWDEHIYTIDTMDKTDNLLFLRGTCCPAQGTLLNVLWEPKWEGDPWKRGYRCRCDGLTWLSSKN